MGTRCVITHTLNARLPGNPGAFATRLRHGSSATVLAVVVAVVAGGCSEKTVRASRFVLTDGEGRQRASFDLAGDGTPKLGFQDALGRLRMSLQFDKDGNPGIHLLDGKGQRRVFVGLQAYENDSVPVVVMGDGDRKGELSLTVAGRGEPALLLRMDPPSEAIRLRVRKDQGATIAISDAADTERMVLGPGGVSQRN